MFEVKGTLYVKALKHMFLDCSLELYRWTKVKRAYDSCRRPEFGSQFPCWVVYNHLEFQPQGTL